MTAAGPEYPRAVPVGDTGVMIEFGDLIDPAVHDRVIALDRALAAAPLTEPIPGLREVAPAFAGLLLLYDPLLTDFDALAAAALALATRCEAAIVTPAVHDIPVCYDADCGPDLLAAAARIGVAPDALAATHAGAEYRVYIYGFAPGYAYLGGVPAALALPRKPVPVRERPVGSVMIAGGQCIITTLVMPTGWWVIGRTAAAVLQPWAPQPFRFAPGDTVRFRAVSRAEFDAALAAT
jgi:inhibitor of KinA